MTTGSGTLLVVGKVGAKCRHRIVSLIGSHPFDWVVEIDFMPLTDHHRVLSRPLRVLDMGEAGIRVGIRGHDDLAGNQDQYRRNVHRHSLRPFLAVAT